MFYIYALVDPSTKQIRYIGKSIRPRERLTNHCNEQSRTWRTNWIRSVLAQGKRPHLLILEELAPDADWKPAERRWIAQGRKMGWPLTNCTDGGDGVSGLPAEIREKMRLTWLGRKHRPESKAKIGAASRKRRHSLLWRKAMSDKMKGRNFTPEWRDRISQAVSKLTDDQIREVRRLLAEHVSQYVIADMFNVHQGTISNIKRGKCYLTAGHRG